MIRALKGEGIEKEQEILKKLLHNEEEVLKVVLSSLNNGKVESMNPDLPKFFVIQSWGVLFGKKLNDIRNDEPTQSSKDLLLLSLDNFINIK